MGNLIDMTGQRFGRLVVVERCGSDNGCRATWKCVCDCGNTVVIEGYHLRSGQTQSCGCLLKDTLSKISYKHGDSHTRLHNIWESMKERCSTPSCIGYPRYGGRGISVCEEWLHDYLAFKDWALTHGYREDLTIDRINVDGNYEPDNCRWVDMIVQQNNRSNNTHLEYMGEVKTIAEWSRTIGIPANKITDRLRRGMSVERAFTKGDLRGTTTVHRRRT